MSEVVDLSHERLVRAMLSTAMAGTGKNAADFEEKVAELKAVIANTDDDTLENITGVSQKGVSLDEALQGVINLGGALRDFAGLVSRFRNR